MLHRLPGALFILLVSSSITLSACAAGGGNSGDDDDDDVSVDAREIDTASPDASSPDASMPDGMVPDAMLPDSMVPLTGETCGMPDVITITGAGGLGTATVTGTTAGYTNHYMPPAACTSTWLQDGPDHVYEIAVPAGARLDALLTPASSFDPGIYLIGAPAASCDANPIVCLAGLDGGGNGGAERVRYSNTTSATVTVFVVIDGTATTGGTFTLAATVETIPPTPPGDTCQLAETVTLTGGMATITGTNATASNFNNNYDGTSANGCVNGDGNDRVHVVTVPAGERLSATLTTQVSSFDATLNLVAGPATTCDASPLVCLDGSDELSGGGTETVRYDNTTAAPVDVMIVVDGYNADDEGAYSVAVTVATIPMNPTGDACTNAEPIALVDGNATVSGSNTEALGYTNNYDGASANGCRNGDGNDHVYSVTVPAGELLVATARPTGFDATMYLVAGPATACAAAPLVCLGGSDVGSLESLTYRNETANPVEVFIIVDGYSSTDEGTYELSVSVGPARGDTCQAAEPITLSNGRATIAGTTGGPMGYAANYAPPAACTSDYAAVGNDHAYLVTVPMGQTLSATMRPSDWDGSIYLVAGPATSCDASPIVCLAGIDDGGTGGAETVTYMNTTGAAAEVLVVVDSYSTSNSGPFVLSVQAQ